MDQSKIGFLSSHKVDMHIELQLVKEYLTTHSDRFTFQYCCRNERIKNYFRKKGAVQARKYFQNEPQHLICADDSLRDKPYQKGTPFKRILLASPANYLFDTNAENKATLTGYSHIISTGPMITRLLKEHYDLSYCELVDRTMSPLAEYLCDPDIQASSRKLMDQYYPYSKGKKILAMFFFGKDPKEEGKIFGDLDPEKLIAALGDEWFIMINSDTLMGIAEKLPARYLGSIGSTKNLCQTWKILPCCEALVTNDSLYTGAFASRRKPYYCIKYQNNLFEDYMKQNHPSLYLEKITALYDLNLDTDEYLSGHPEFFRDFCFDEPSGSCESILKILSE